MKRHFLSAVLLITAYLASGQPAQIPVSDNYLKRNYVTGYLGIFEWNLNYERNILQRPRSYTNLRAGIGFWEDQPTYDAYGGVYLNPAVVHIIGKRTAHFELVMGIKYFITNQDEIEKAWLGYDYLPDLFFGYRHEKPDGKFLLRLGISVPTMVNIGAGFKF